MIDAYKQVTMARIQTLELSQNRAIREFILGDLTALDKLKKIDKEISDLREQLK